MCATGVLRSCGARPARSASRKSSRRTSTRSSSSRPRAGLQRAPTRALRDGGLEQRRGARLVLNKIDLDADLAPLLEAIERAAIGVPVVRASAATGAGLDELRAHIRIRAAPSASSAPRASASRRSRTGCSAETCRRSRACATTTAAATRRPRASSSSSDGGVLIDTPGMRELGLLEDEGRIETTFADVAAFAALPLPRLHAHDGARLRRPRGGAGGRPCGRSARELPQGHAGDRRGGAPATRSSRAARRRAGR